MRSIECVAVSCVWVTEIRYTCVCGYIRLFCGYIGLFCGWLYDEVYWVCGCKLRVGHRDTVYVCVRIYTALLRIHRALWRTYRALLQMTPHKSLLSVVSSCVRVTVIFYMCVCGYIGHFCGYIGNFCGYIGLFSKWLIWYTCVCGYIGHGQQRVGRGCADIWFSCTSI